jgi:aspartyl-tRNA(Asn)/glutamyl-tRNA(Gln) amidotransferase subunit C
MSKKISKKQVKHLADLAMLDLTSEEVTKYVSQLEDILEYFQILDELDIIEKNNNVSIKENGLREDEVRDSLPKKQVLKNRKNKIKDKYLEV